jgi:tRNA (guanine-N7-)-methyltransferase
VRKPRRLPVDALAPYEYVPPLAFATGWGIGPAQTQVESNEPIPRIDWQELFQNQNPVEIEVGFGKGLFLVTEATRQPNTNFFGIEIIRKYQRYASNRVAARQLANCKTCWADAKRILRDLVPPDSVQTVHIFFPDPWWKSKHKKRTLFTSEFASIVLGVLKPGGALHFVTDVKDYFGMVMGVVTGIPAFRELPPPPESAPAHDMDYLTNFERKFRKEGRPIHRMRWSKG